MIASVAVTVSAVKSAQLFITLHKICQFVGLKKTRRERLKSALYLWLKKRSFQMCIGPFHEKKYVLNLRLLSIKQYSSDISSKLRKKRFPPDIMSKIRSVLKKTWRIYETKYPRNMKILRQSHTAGRCKRKTLCAI